MRIGNDFHSWLRHSWKSLPNRLTRDKKSLFTVTHALFFISYMLLYAYSFCCSHQSGLFLSHYMKTHHWNVYAILAYFSCAHKSMLNAHQLTNSICQYQFHTTSYTHIRMVEELKAGTGGGCFHNAQGHQPLGCSPIARFMGPTWGPSGADRT